MFVDGIGYCKEAVFDYILEGKLRNTALLKVAFCENHPGNGFQLYFTVNMKDEVGAEARGH